MAFCCPPQWFRDIIRDVALIVMREWAERCLPCPAEKPPEKPGKAMLTGSVFYPVQNLEEYLALTQTVPPFNILGSVAAYVSSGSVVIMNTAVPPIPMDPQPAINTIQMDQTNLTNFYLTADRRVVIIPNDAQPAATPWTGAISAVATGTEDDATLSGEYDPDQAGSVDAGALGTFAPITDPAAVPPPG